MSRSPSCGTYKRFKQGSIWGHENAQNEPGGTSARNQRTVVNDEALVYRGVPVDLNGRLPTTLLARLEQRRRERRRDTDLIRYGVVLEKSIHA
jgi:hypothetical protein